MGSGGGGGWHPIRDTWEKVKETGRKIKEFLFGSSEKAGYSTGQEDRYDPERARMEETIRINKILTDFRTEIEDKCDSLERDTIKLCRKSLDELINYLKKINNNNYGSKKLNININRLVRENRKTEDEVYGFIKKYVQKRVSLDDIECLNILKMDSGSDKEKSMTDFSNKVLKEAINKLSERIKKSIEEQCENVFFEIQDRVSLVQQSATEVLDKFKEIEKLKLQDEVGLEKEKSRIVYCISLSEKVLSQFEVKI